MYTFVIEAPVTQTINDFSFHLMKAVDYHNWLTPQQKSYDILLDDCIGNIEWSKILTPDSIVPIGSLEFVYKYVKEFYNLDKKFIQPINVPPELRHHYFTKREIGITDYSDNAKKYVSFGDDVFVKSHTKYKGYCDIQRPHYTMPEKDYYFVSGVIDIISEYRCFIYDRKIVGMKHYAGSFFNYPAPLFIEHIIHEYKNAPRSYTLDIAVLKNGQTAIIEVHPMVSVGLYGFDDYKYLPSMFINGYRWMVKEGLNLKNKNSHKLD